MSDSRFVVTTFRIPREVHSKAKMYIKEFNQTVSWKEKKLSLTVLVGKSIKGYMKVHPLIEEEITNEELKKPKCKLVSENGNIFKLMNIARNAIINDAKLRANQMTEKIQRSENHDEALQIIMSYVEAE